MNRELGFEQDVAPGALVRASTVATEAKTLVLVEAGLKTPEGTWSPRPLLMSPS